MRPLKVTATLNSPLAGEAPMLDALLERVMAIHMPSILASSGGWKHASGRPSSIPIPIARTRLGDYPHLIPMSSAPICSRPLAETHEHYARAFPVELAELLEPGQRIQINTGSGEHRSYRLPLRVAWVDRIVWFAVGVPKEVRRLLRRVWAVGKKPSIGYGRVSQWMVEPIDEDYAWFAPSPAGPVLMRTLPAGDWLPPDLVGYRPWFGTPVAPYWDKTLYADVVQPC